MKPRYAIINEEARNEFEMEWQMPFGYATCEIFFSFDEALDYFCDNYSKGSIEKFDSEGREIVYRK